MKKYAIDGKELFCMMVLFELGSAILFGLGAEAKQDAWMAVLLGLIAGIFIFMLYTSLYKFSDNLSLIAFLKAIFGKYIGWMIGWVYVIYFIYLASRILRDFTSLIRIVAYENTGYLTIAIGIILCVMYASYKGLEVFARFSLIIFFFVMVSLITIIILEFSSGLVHFQQLQPILEKGIEPVFKAAFPALATFPYGELIVFLMIFPQVHSSSNILKVGINAILLGGGILFLFTILNLSILGAGVFSRSSFPLLTSVSYINIANFIQRIEFILLFLMVLLGFVKIFLFIYCAILGTSELFQIRTNALIYPITFLIIFSSVFISANISEHIEEGLNFVPIYLHLPLQIYIPIILLLVAWIKNKKRTSVKKP
jgi:spore germination protein KB